MTTMTELTPQVIAYLVDQCDANSSLGAADPPVTVFDGPAAAGDIQMTAGTGLLWIGAAGAGAPGSAAQAATATQGFAFLDKARTRNDQMDIQCAAEYVSGDSVMATARNEAYAIVAALEIMLRGDPSVGPGDATMGGLVAWSEVTGPVELLQAQTASGADALVKFRISAFVRLTS